MGGGGGIGGGSGGGSSGGDGGDSSNGGLGAGFGGLGGLNAFGGGTGSMGAADSAAPGADGMGALSQANMAAGGTNDLGYTAGDYDRAMTSFSAPVGDYSGALGLNPSVANAANDATVGGILTGGPLNGWGTLATALGYAVPGLGPAMTALSIGNMALGATNSIGATDTGALSSPKSVAGSIADASGLTGLLGKIGGETPATSAASYSSMMSKNDVNPYSGQNNAPDAPGAQESQQSSTSTTGAGNGRELASNEPTRDPGILAAITGLPASVFKSPYEAKRTTPELSQGLLQSSIWSNSRA